MRQALTCGSQACAAARQAALCVHGFEGRSPAAKVCCDVFKCCLYLAQPNCKRSARLHLSQQV